ncbi:MAG: hypothetical protein ACYDHW_07130 [Syntrophorhabdaceae bacterium]
MNQEALKFVLSPEDVTDDLIIRKCKNPRDAVKLCRDCSPLSDDEIRAAIEHETGRLLDKGHFSQMINGQGGRNFPPELMTVFEDVCGNWIITRYFALYRNCELKPKKEALELELENAQKEADEYRKKYEYAIEALRAVKG